MSKMIVIGSSGQVGRTILEQFPEALGYDFPEIDITNIDSLSTLYEHTDCKTIVLAAAYTAVDQAESDRSKAIDVNGNGPKYVAQVAARLGARLIHFSSDYVYNGEGTHPFTEEEPTNPINTYGDSKALGDHNIEKSGCSYVILRTSWVVSPYGNNFVKSILNLARTKLELSVVNDQIGSPTSARVLSQAIQDIGKQNVSDGIYHIACRHFTSWYDIAVRIVAKAKERQPHVVKVKKIEPIPSSQWPVPAARPKNSRLDTSKIRKILPNELPSWETEVDHIVETLLEENRSNSE